VGSGFRTFTAGEVLTASNVQNYLMDQSVMVFGGSAARSSAIGTANFEEGMVSYLTDTDKVEAYNGTNWVSVAPASTQGLTLINTTSFSAVASASLPASTFTSTYQNYLIKGNLIGNTDTTINFRLRAAGTDSTGANYGFQELFISSTTLTGTRTTGQTTAFITVTGSVYKANFELNLYRPQLAEPTTYNCVAYRSQSTATGNFTTGVNTLSTSFDSATILSGGVDTLTGNVSVYGYNL